MNEVLETPATAIAERCRGDITQDELRALLRYEPETGEFFRLVRTSNRVKIGDKAGHTMGKKGYLYICLYGRNYAAHRLAWLYVKGSWPVGECDHRDHVHDNNRIANLRDETEVVNQHNQTTAHRQSKTGLLGASFDAQKGMFVAQIKAGPKSHFLGYHATAEAAHAAYVAAKRQLHHGATL